MYQGLEERFRAVDGLTTILLGEPSSVHAAPALYTALLRFTRATSGNVTTMHYFFMHRLVILWQDNPQAEMQLLNLTNAIPAAIDDDSRLGGRIVGGMAQIVTGDAGYTRIGDILYRILDFTSDVKENGTAKGVI